MRWLPRVKKPWHQAAVLIATASIAGYFVFASNPQRIEEPGYCDGEKPADARPATPGYRFLKGDRNTYRLTYESNSEHDISVLLKQEDDKNTPAEQSPGMMGRQEIRSTLSADLEATVVDRSDDGYRIEYRFIEPRFQIYSNGELAEGYTLLVQNDLVQRVLVSLDPQGKVVALAVKKEINQISHGFIRALLGLTQFVVPRDAAAGRQWTVREDDSNGSYDATYKLVKGKNDEGSTSTYKKTKGNHLFLAIPKSSDTKRPTHQVLPGGELVAVFDLAHSRLKGIEGVVKEEIRIAKRRVAHGSSTLKMSHLSYACRAQEVFARSGQSEADADLAAPVPLYSDGTTAEQREARLYRSALGKDTVETLIAHLPDLDAGDQSKISDTDLYLKFKALVFLQPESSHAIGRYLRGRPLTSDSFQMLAGVLGVVGNVEAQQALIDLMKQRASEPDTVVHLIREAATVKKPATGLVEYMSTLTRSNHTGVSETAELASGVLARNLYQQDRRQSDRIIQPFVAKLQSASDPNRTQLMIRVLGNAATPLAYKTITDFLDHESPDLRAVALSSLRMVQVPEVDRHLRTALKKDTDSEVRKAAAATIGFRPMNDAGFTALKSAFKDDSDSGVRRTILEVLWNARRDYPEAGKIVAAAAESDHDPEVRKAAKSLLPAK